MYGSKDSGEKAYYVTVTTYAGNRLVQEVCAYAQQYDRCVIRGKLMPEFEKDLIAKVEELNKLYNRCLPLEVGRTKIQEGFHYYANRDEWHPALVLNATEINKFYV